MRGTESEYKGNTLEEMRANLWYSWKKLAMGFEPILTSGEEQNKVMGAGLGDL